MKKAILALLFLVPNLVVSQNEFATSILESSEKMGEAVLASDYETLADYTYPVLLELMGGRANMIKVAENAMKQIQNQGYKLSDFEFGRPEKIFQAGDELHCLLPQTLKIKSLDGTIINKSYLIAVSLNQGDSWYFVDTADLTNENVYELFPNFNTKLSIPIKKEPEFIPN